MQVASVPRVAVLLNRNAKGVSSDVVRSMRDLAAADLFVSTDFEQASEIARRVVEAGYRTVMVGGGDGTFVRWASEIVRLAERAGIPAPRFGLLALGTGNALAATLGAERPTPEQVRRLLLEAPAVPAQDVELLEVEGQLAPFAGFGLDALILEDHKTVDDLFRSAGVRLHAGAGYALSVLLRSIPRFLVSDLVEATVINGDHAAIALGPDGESLGEPIAPGRVLYRGRAALATCSTIPFWGLKMRMFPFAQRYPGRFQVRIYDGGAAEALANLPAVWRGEYRSPRIHDFACRAVEVRVDRPAPLQVGGDLIGRRERVAVAMASRRVRVFA